MTFPGFKNTNEIANMVAEELISMKESELETTKAELEAKLAELETARETAREATKKSQEPRVLPMDEEDKLRLENILLHEKIVSRERQDARDAFHTKLIAKYSVNILTHIISVDANTGNITIDLK